MSSVTNVRPAIRNETKLIYCDMDYEQQELMILAKTKGSLYLDYFHQVTIKTIFYQTSLSFTENCDLLMFVLF